MEVSVKMLKVMVISGQGGGVVNITLNGKRVEQVIKFCYLGSWITDNRNCDRN